MRLVLLTLGFLSLALSAVFVFAGENTELAVTYAAWSAGGSILPFTFAEILRLLEIIAAKPD